ncbi:MAG TPA: uracil-DNA glycosylase [Pelolinea sp.]|nr:uracil-DNA glycosylase [Pelolinea sp.]
MQNNKNLVALNEVIIHCRECPRLVEWREIVAVRKKKAYVDREYWGKPGPGFGDINGRLLIIGLAPGAHGSNRTGRMFTGDASGDFLFPALHHAGFANQPNAESSSDGLELFNVFITAVCRCVPPKNKPTRMEIENCRYYLKSEMKLMRNLKGIVALGSIAFYESILLLKNTYNFQSEIKLKFGHGSVYLEKNTHTPWLLASYHPSRQNTQTGRLTEKMFASIWRKAKNLLPTRN